MGKANMHMRIEIVEERPTLLLRDLADVLESASTLGDTRIHTVERRIEPGQLGGELEAVEAFLTNKDTITPLLTAIGGWLVARVGRKTRVKIQLGERQAEIETGGSADPIEIARELKRQLDVDG
jgi:hypothetical protein